MANGSNGRLTLKCNQAESVCSFSSDRVVGGVKSYDRLVRPSQYRMKLLMNWFHSPFFSLFCFTTRPRLDLLVTADDMPSLTLSAPENMNFATTCLDGENVPTQFHIPPHLFIVDVVSKTFGNLGGIGC